MEWIKVTSGLDLTSLLNKDLLFIVNGNCYKGNLDEDTLMFCDDIYNYEYNGEYKKEEVSYYCIIELP